MTLRTRLTAVTAASVLLLALAGCTTPAATGTDGTDSGTDSDTSTEETTESGSSAGVTLPGTGEYTIPDQAPIGGYELPENQDGLPEGCTWQLYLTSGELFVENQGSFVFFTDVTGKFVTNGCPDWVQFE